MTARLPYVGISRFQAGMPITRLGTYGVATPIPVQSQRAGRRRSVSTASVSTADEALAKIYEEQSGPLTGLAALLVWAARPADVPMITGATPGTQALPPGIEAIPEAIREIAEEIVQDSLVAMYRDWLRLRDVDRAVAYLRRAIVHEARAHGRAPRARREAGTPRVGRGDAGLSAMSAVVLAALRRLPGRQREALVLRYYADLPEAAAADAMGVTRAAFRGHAARGLVALRLLLDQCG